MDGRSGPRGAVGRVVDRASGALWSLPSVAIVLALGLGVGLPLVDELLQRGGEPLTYVFGGGPSAARGMLGAIAGSLISVTTLLFSLTIVTLQLASSQYSPRLLQTFARDRVVQVCLGILLGTFVYALTVLRSVRSADESGAGPFVPRLSVTVAFLLTLVSVAALVTFLAHQTQQLRVETMMRDVHAEADVVLARLRRRQADDDQPDAPLPPVPEHARPLCARSSGFLVRVEERRLVRAAADAGAVLRVDVRPGDAVVEGTPVAWVWAGERAGGWSADELEEDLSRALVVGHERAEVADPSYGLRKLVDIATRAVSPGINDPTTAVHALSHVSALLGAATTRDTWHRRLSDGDRQRVALRSWRFAELLDLGVTQIRDYGRRDAAVVARLFAVLAEVGWRVTTAAQRDAVRHQCRVLAEQSLAEPPAGRTAEDVHRRVAAVDDALAHQRRPSSA